jgi:hypothetical protein
MTLTRAAACRLAGWPGSKHHPCPAAAAPTCWLWGGTSPAAGETDTAQGQAASVGQRQAKGSATSLVLDRRSSRW